MYGLLSFAGLFVSVSMEVVDVYGFAPAVGVELFVAWSVDFGHRDFRLRTGFFGLCHVCLLYFS